MAEEDERHTRSSRQARRASQASEKSCQSRKGRHEARVQLARARLDVLRRLRGGWPHRDGALHVPQRADRATRPRSRSASPATSRSAVVDDALQGKVPQSGWCATRRGSTRSSTICTHLGCTPNWLEAENKFKCPCHGSGFYMSGINFEGPAPRPLERVTVSLADDGQVLVDKRPHRSNKKPGSGTTPSPS